MANAEELRKYDFEGFQSGAERTSRKPEEKLNKSAARLIGSNLSTSPRQDEFEISLFGPGYGEGVLLHLGNNDWIIIDSCVNEAAKTVLPLEYLLRIGVDPSDTVKLVVSSHWHDDHIRGLAAIVRECKSAEFVCSLALRNPEFLTLVSALGEHALMTSSGVGEFYQILQLLVEERRNSAAGLKWASADRLLWRRSSATSPWGSCEIVALSPSDAAITFALHNISNLIPVSGTSKRRVMPQGPNHTAVVLWVKMDHFSVLLGADLEETGDNGTGWSAIVMSPTRPSGKAEVFKVPHHGSENGDYQDVWREVINERPVAILTPFCLGNIQLPKDSDIYRLCSRTPDLFATAVPVAKKTRRSGIVEKMIRETVVSIRQVHGATGHIRLRRSLSPTGDKKWKIELFGNASPLCQKLPQ